jgi:hypothetical protein
VSNQRRIAVVPDSTSPRLRVALAGRFHTSSVPQERSHNSAIVVPGLGVFLLCCPRLHQSSCRRRRVGLPRTACYFLRSR